MNYNVCIIHQKQKQNQYADKLTSFKKCAIYSFHFDDVSWVRKKKPIFCGCSYFHGAAEHLTETQKA